MRAWPCASAHASRRWFALAAGDGVGLVRPVPAGWRADFVEWLFHQSTLRKSALSSSVSVWRPKNASNTFALPAAVETILPPKLANVPPDDHLVARQQRPHGIVEISLVNRAVPYAPAQMSNGSVRHRIRPGIAELQHPLHAAGAVDAAPGIVVKVHLGKYVVGEERDAYRNDLAVDGGDAPRPWGTHVSKC